MNCVEDYIRAFLEEVESRKTVDYANKESVKQFNAAYDRAVNYVKYIDKHYPEQIFMLMGLLNHPDVQVIAHCAPMILQMDNSTRKQKHLALETIVKLTEDSRLNKVERFGLKISLEKWKDIYKKDE